MNEEALAHWGGGGGGGGGGRAVVPNKKMVPNRSVGMFVVK